MNRLRVFLAVFAAIALLMSPPASALAPAACAATACVRDVASLSFSADPELFERLGVAAEDGDVEAMNLLGVLFVTNARVPSDYSMALYWFQRAVDAGSVDGMHNLATMYLRGVGVGRDYANAYHWFQRAAEGGNAFAAFSVAAMAEHGLGCARDLALARRMYRNAAEAGVPLAMIWVSQDLSGGGPHHDPIEAYAWLEVAVLADLDGQLQVVVFGRMEELGNRLGPAKRDQARAKAARIVADMRARAAAQAPPATRQPAPSRRFPSA